MSEAQRGVVGVRWGVQGIGLMVGILSPVCLFQSLDLTRDGDSVAIKDDTGETLGYIDSDPTKMINFTVIPSGTSKAAAQGQVDNMLPQKGTTITLTDSKGAIIDAHHGGAYRCESAKVGMTNTGVATIDIQCKQHDNHDVTPLIS